MRLGIQAENILERAALASGQLPTPLVEGIWGLLLSKTLLTAVRLGIFTAIGSSQTTADELSERLGYDLRGTEVLLNALVGFDYLTRKNGQYAVPGRVRRWLSADSKHDLSDAMRFMGVVDELFADVEGTVRNGPGANLHHRGLDSDFWEGYMRGLASFGRLAGGEVAGKLRLDEEPQRMLDVGGGHGMYTVAFLRKYGRLSADILDLPQAAAHGRTLISEEDERATKPGSGATGAARFGARTHFIEGDLRTLDWGSGYDLVLLFNILHNLSESEAEVAVGRAFNALRPGGTLVILDSEHQGGDGDLSTAAGANELLFYVLSGAQAYPEEQMTGWMAEAGFTRLRSWRLMMTPMAVLMSGRKEVETVPAEVVTAKAKARAAAKSKTRLTPEPA